MRRPLLFALVLAFTVAVLAGGALLLSSGDTPDEAVLAPTATLSPAPSSTPSFPYRPTVATPDPQRDIPQVSLVDTQNGGVIPLWEPGYRIHEVVFHKDYVYYVRIPWPPGGSSPEIMVFNLQTHQSPRKLADGSNISISVNGDIAYTTHAPDGTTIGAMLDRFGRQAPNPGGSGRFSWSPDGRWLASSSGYMGDGVPMPQYIMDFDFRTGRVRQFAETLPCNCDGGARVVWAPDSARFQFTRLTGSPSQRLPLSELYEPWGLTRVQAPSLLAWLDATHYSTLPESDEPRYSIYDVVTGARIPLSAAAVPSPSGDLLATREGPMNGTFVVLRTDGSLVLNELEGRFEAWSSDGSYILAATGEFGPRAGLRVFNHAGNLVYSRDGAAGTFSPDATKLAAVESRFADPIHASTADLWIVDLATGIERKVASDLRGGLGCAKWSEDSRYVAVTFCPGV